MRVIRTPKGLYQSVEYTNEKDFESAILKVQDDLFGPDRFYLDVKKKIGGKNKNIPDGYLLDLSGANPRLYVVENELASHDPLKHIAVQILEFSLSFKTEPLKVKKILYEAIRSSKDHTSKCEKFAEENEFHNLDRLLEYLVFEAPFMALVIIDEVPDRLEKVLTGEFKFGVEILTLGRYEDEAGDRLYHFEPFLADVKGDLDAIEDKTKESRRIDQSELDTVVVPAHQEGFEKTFLRENRWHAIRLHASMHPLIKYIAVYQVADISSITHIAPVKSIEPWEEGGKHVVNFAESAKKIRPIPRKKKGRIKELRSFRYTTRERLMDAKTLDDIW